MIDVTTFRIRLGAELNSLEPPIDELRPNAPAPGIALRAGDRVRLELAVLDQGTPVSLAEIASLTLEIKPATVVVTRTESETKTTYTAPPLSTRPLLTSSLSAAELNSELSQTAWESLGADNAQAVFTLNSTATAMAPGRRWLTISARLTSDPTQARVIVSTPIEVLGGGLSTEPVTDPQDPATGYSQSESTALFAGRANNLSDLADAATARTNLGLGTAAEQDVGTGANNVPQLDANGNLPANVELAEVLTAQVPDAGVLGRFRGVPTVGDGSTVRGRVIGGDQLALPADISAFNNDTPTVAEFSVTAGVIYELFLSFEMNDTLEETPPRLDLRLGDATYGDEQFVGFAQPPSVHDVLLASGAAMLDRPINPRPTASLTVDGTGIGTPHFSAGWHFIVHAQNTGNLRAVYVAETSDPQFTGDEVSITNIFARLRPIGFTA